jgi:hypothetical protein
MEQKQSVSFSRLSASKVRATIPPLRNKRGCLNGNSMRARAISAYGLDAINRQLLDSRPTCPAQAKRPKARPKTVKAFSCAESDRKKIECQSDRKSASSKMTSTLTLDGEEHPTRNSLPILPKSMKAKSTSAPKALITSAPDGAAKALRLELKFKERENQEFKEKALQDQRMLNKLSRKLAEQRMVYDGAQYFKEMRHKFTQNENLLSACVQWERGHITGYEAQELTDTAMVGHVSQNQQRSIRNVSCEWAVQQQRGKSEIL